MRKQSHRHSSWKASNGMTKRQVRRLPDGLNKAVLKFEMIMASLNSR